MHTVICRGVCVCGVCVGGVCVCGSVVAASVKYTGRVFPVTLCVSEQL